MSYPFSVGCRVPAVPHYSTRNAAAHGIEKESYGRLQLRQLMAKQPGRMYLSLALSDDDFILINALHSLSRVHHLR